MEFLLFLALLPAIALMVYVFKKDKVEREPVGIVVRVFVFGALSGIVAALVEGVLIGAFEMLIPEGMLLLVVTYFIGVAAVEEACKYACLLTVRKNPALDYVFDAIVYAVAAALGFAALENVFYVIDGGLETAVMRAIFSVPGHMADGVVMGVFFGLARKYELHGNAASARTYYWLAFLLPVLEHGLYDSMLSTDSGLLALAALGVDLVFIAIAFIIVSSTSKNDSRLYPGFDVYAAGAAPAQSQSQQQPAPAQWQQGQQQVQVAPAQSQQPQQPAPAQWQQGQQQVQQGPQSQQQAAPAQWQQPPAQGNAPEATTHSYGNGPTVRYSSQRRD